MSCHQQKKKINSCDKWSFQTPSKKRERIVLKALSCLESVQWSSCYGAFITIHNHLDVYHPKCKLIEWSHFESILCVCFLYFLFALACIYTECILHTCIFSCLKHILFPTLFKFMIKFKINATVIRCEMNNAFAFV